MSAESNADIARSRHVGGRRMLMVGEFGSAHPCHYFARSLREAGWHVIELDFAKFFPRTGRSILSRVAGRLLGGEFVRILTQAIEDCAKVNGVECVFFTKAIGATVGLVESLKRNNVSTVCWYPDVVFDHTIVDSRVIEHFDIFITTKDFHMPYLIENRPSKINVLIEHGYCNDVHWRSDPIVPWQQRKFDIAFIGNHSSFKEEWMVGLVGRRPALSFMIVGERWQSVRWPADARAVTVCSAMAGDAMSRIMNDSRAAVSVHHGPVGHAHGWQDSVSARTFEIPACGTAMLHIRGSYLRELYDEGNETLCFDDLDGLVTNVDQLLADPEKAMAMAARAYDRTVPEYGYLARGREIARVLEVHIDLLPEKRS